MLHASATVTQSPTTVPSVMPEQPAMPRWIPEPVVIQRVRRRLRKQGQSLRTITAGKEYAVVGHDPIESIGLLELARLVGALSTRELVDPLPERGWLHYIARLRVVIVDGVKCQYHDRLTRDYTTVEAARRAGAKIEDRENLRLCSYDPT